MRCKDRKKEEIHLRGLNKQITKKEYHNDGNRLIFHTKDIGFRNTIVLFLISQETFITIIGTLVNISE